MLGGLYGDLPPPSDEESKPSSVNQTANVWSSATKMAPPTLRKPQPQPLPQQTLLKPKQTLINKSDDVATTFTSITLQQQQQAFVGATSAVVDEYDPARPNDYEEYRRERKKKEMDAERRRRQEEEEEEEEEEDNNLTPSSHITGEEAWRRRAAMSSGNDKETAAAAAGGFIIGKSETTGLGLGAGGQMTAAQRMMAKMGWKEGQGLGKQEQGITTPLMAKKTDRRAGVIVNASDNNNKDKKVKSTNFNGPPTRVLLLRNMVGPGEVDDELEDEVGSECSKYGTVTRVLIFEITEPNFPSDEAVRIFIQFERSEETTKAYVDLDGRYFGGRIVRAAFYDEERFNNNELAPLPGEVPGFT